jgi:hypothetical protein
MGHGKLTEKQAKEVADKLKIKFKDFDLDEFRRGMEVELEHGLHDPETNVTNNDLHMTGKIAWAHLKEIPDYYDWLDRMEKEAEAHWEKRKKK